MDIATAALQGATGTPTRSTTMNTFEKNTRIDTTLSGGMIAIAFAWTMFAAIHGPVGANATDASPQVAANANAAVTQVRRHAAGQDTSSRVAHSTKVS